jgi:ribosomal protein S9
VSKPLIQTTGRRKESVARVRLRPGTGVIVVNGRPFAAYFPILTHQVIAKEPLRLTQTEEVYDVEATLDERKTGRTNGSERGKIRGRRGNVQDGSIIWGQTKTE